MDDRRHPPGPDPGGGQDHSIHSRVAPTPHDSTSNLSPSPGQLTVRSTVPICHGHAHTNRRVRRRQAALSQTGVFIDHPNLWYPIAELPLRDEEQHRCFSSSLDLVEGIARASGSRIMFAKAIANHNGFTPWQQHEYEQRGIDWATAKPGRKRGADDRMLTAKLLTCHASTIILVAGDGDYDSALEEHPARDKIVAAWCGTVGKLPLSAITSVLLLRLTTSGEVVLVREEDAVAVLVRAIAGQGGAISSSDFGRITDSRFPDKNRVVSWYNSTASELVRRWKHWLEWLPAADGGGVASVSLTAAGRELAWGGEASGTG